jgi:hypothetical protein
MAKDAPGTMAFLQACEKVRASIEKLEGWDACLALTICLAECIVFGNSKDDNPDEELRLAGVIKALGGITADMMTGDKGDDGDDDDDEEGPRPPFPELLHKLLEHRRAVKPRAVAPATRTKEK